MRCDVLLNGGDDGGGGDDSGNSVGGAGVRGDDASKALFMW